MSIKKKVERKNEMEEIAAFKIKLTEFLLPHLKKSDPMMVAGVLMKSTMEIYTTHLSEKDMYKLLNVVIESVPIIKESVDMNSNSNNTIH